MMIKTPVKRCIVTDKITDADGLLIADCADVGCASDVEMRINMHDELVDELEQIKIFLDEIHVMPVNWITKEGVYRRAVVCELLERCK